MTFKVSRKAHADLRNIGLYTQQTWGPDQRRKYLNGLNAKFHFLSENPSLSPLRTEFTPAVRIHHHEKHLIVYITGTSFILIFRVLHESMDIDSHL